MQKINSNIIILIFSFCCFITPSINCQKSNLDIADSLFYKEKYNESKNYYDSLYFINKLYTESMLLKMAFIEEQLENYENSLKKDQSLKEKDLKDLKTLISKQINDEFKNSFFNSSISSPP